MCFRINNDSILNYVGRMSFTSHTPGEHVICMYSNSTAWFSGSQLRVHLDIQVGEHAIDYANVAQREKLTELQVRIRQLLDQVEQITKEQNYQRVCFFFFLNINYLFNKFNISNISSNFYVFTF